MHVRIIVTDDNGTSYEGEVEVAPAGSAARKPKISRSRTVRVQDTGASLDYGLPVRAFMKRYARGLTGPRKFTLLLARLAVGQLGHPIPAKDVEREWNRMTELTGGDFNSAYSSRARTEGWVDLSKRGSYVLLKDWKEAIQA